MELPALAADSVAALVRTRLGGDADPRFAAACAEATRGNPLLLRELLRTLADNRVRPAGDQALVVEEFRGRILAGTVVKRLAGEPEAVRLLVRALVVLGDGTGWPVAAELAGLGEARTRELGRRLQRIGVLAPGDPARFEHPLVRAAIAEALCGPVELADGHAQAAELLRREGVSEAVVAAHLLLAEPNGEAWRVDVLREAARATRGRGAPEVTVTYLRRALREPMSVKERGPLLLELGADELQVDVGAARHRLARAADALTDPYSRAQAAHLLAHALFLGQQHEDAVDVLARAVEDLREAEDGSGIAREVSWYLQAQMLLIGYDQLSTLPAARLRARRLRDHALAGDTPGECAMLAALSVSALSGEAGAAVADDLMDRALRGGLAGTDQTQMLLSLAGLAFVATDRLDDAAARFDQIADVAGRWGSFLMVSAALTWQVSISRHRGRQLALTPEFGHPAMSDEDMELRVRAAMMTQVGESMIERGDLAGAARALAPDADSDRVGWAWQGPMLLVRSRAHAERGDPAAALAVLLEYGAQERWAQVTNLALAPWRSQAALAHLALGQRADALRLAAEELELAHRWGTERSIGVASRCLGVVTGGAEGAALLREAVGVLKRSPAHLELARARYDLGIALARTGEADRARQSLAQALDRAQACGSVLLAGRARRALTELGVRPRPVPPPAPQPVDDRAPRAGAGRRRPQRPADRPGPAADPAGRDRADRPGGPHPGCHRPGRPGRPRAGHRTREPAVTAGRRPRRTGRPVRAGCRRLVSHHVSHHVSQDRPPAAGPHRVGSAGQGPELAGAAQEGDGVACRRGQCLIAAAVVCVLQAHVQVLARDPPRQTIKTADTRPRPARVGATRRHAGRVRDIPARRRTKGRRARSG
ncbi:hypothetical protein OG403_35750 [Kitasatospora sp. NBC_01266]|nr:hypothetical protein [Kitasatospora sp. NBC_01266]